MSKPETQEVKNPTAIAVDKKAIAFKPKNWEELWKFAQLICKTEFVPPPFRDKPGECLAAIQTGHEVGLPPMASLQSIAVINGRPTIWGDGALALVKAHPLCDWVHELPAQEAERVGYGECSVRRKGDPEVITRRFSVEMAQRAGLIQRSGEKGVWATYRGRMLQMRARGWAMRDAIPEALKGVAIREEVEDYDVEITPEKPQPLAPDKPKLEQLKESLKAEAALKPELVKEAPHPESAEKKPESGSTPIQVLISDIESLSTVTDIDEMSAQLNKRMKKTGITEENDILNIAKILDKKREEILEHTELPEK